MAVETIGYQQISDYIERLSQRELSSVTIKQHLVAGPGILGAGAYGVELLAEELRLAHEALGRITGQVTADQLLGETFRDFCIGK